MGKTILATGFARKVASRLSVGSQIFSLEVTEDQIVARILADLAYSPRHPVTFGEIMLGALDDAGLNAIEEARDRLAAMPLALDVAPSLSVAEIAARVRSEKARMARRGIRLGVVFIDYMKFVRATDRYRGNRVYEVGEITKELKALAKAEGLCVVLLAQVNRAIESRDRKDRSPGLADLRESGDLEADADVVLFIDRESVRIKQSQEYKAGDPEALSHFLELEHQADLIVAKTRVGSERTVSVWFHAGASTFSSLNRGGFAND
jgi:replicative DNA helicase